MGLRKIWSYIDESARKGRGRRIAHQATATAGMAKLWQNTKCKSFIALIRMISENQ